MCNKKPKVLFVAPLPPPLAGPENSAKMFLESKVSNYFDVISLNTNFRASNADKGKVGFSLFTAFLKLNFELAKALIFHRPHTRILVIRLQ